MMLLIRYSHPVHLATFESQWEDLQEALKLTNEEERQAAVDPFFLATFLGVLALGLVSSSYSFG